MSDDGVVAMVLIGLVIFAVFCLGLDAVLSDVARAIVADWRRLWPT
jgi:hypothetical protein